METQAKNVGTIKNFSGLYDSGIAIITIEDENGIKQDIYCDNAPTVRSLAEIFPNVIGPDHTISLKAIIGKKILWAMDDMGLTLGYIAPLESEQGE